MAEPIRNISGREVIQVAQGMRFPIDVTFVRSPFIGVMNRTNMTLYLGTRQTDQPVGDAFKLNPYDILSFPMDTDILRIWYEDGSIEEGDSIAIFYGNTPIQLSGANLMPVDFTQSVEVKDGSVQIKPGSNTIGNVNVNNFPSQQHTIVDNLPAQFGVNNFPLNQAVTVSNFPAVQVAKLVRPDNVGGGQLPTIGQVQINGQPTVLSRPAQNSYYAHTTSSAKTITLATIEKINVVKASTKASNTMTVTVPAWNGIPAQTFDIDITKTGSFDLGISEFGAGAVDVVFRQNGSNDIEAAHVVITYVGG